MATWMLVEDPANAEKDSLCFLNYLVAVRGEDQFRHFCFSPEISCHLFR